MLLGLDLASRLSGWCCGDGAQIPECGAWEFPKIDGDYGLLLATLDDYLNIAHQRFGFQAVSYEAPILIARGRNGERYGDDLGKLRLLYPMGAFVEYWCRRHDVECWEVTIQEIKKEVTGNVHAAKDDMVAMARKCGLALPEGSYEGRVRAEDAADAWGAWLLLLRYLDKGRSSEWDRRIWTPRGALL